MSRSKPSYRSPFVESDESDDTTSRSQPQAPIPSAAPVPIPSSLHTGINPKRKRAAVEHDTLEDEWEEIGKLEDNNDRAPKKLRLDEYEKVSNDNRPEKDPRNDTKRKHHTTYDEKHVRDAKRTSDSFLATEVRRRREQGLPVLNTLEEEIFMAQYADMARKVYNKITFDQIKENTGLLRMLTSNQTAESDHDIHMAALFAAQLSRVSIELDAIDSFMESRNEVTLQDLSTMQGSINRLFQHLAKDKMWRQLIAHLKLMTESLSMLRDLVKTSPQLRHMTHVAARIDCIESLLTPSDNGEYDVAFPSEPLDDAREQTRDSDAKIAEIEERHKKELTRKDQEILNVQLRLNHATATKDEDQGRQRTIEHLRAECDTTKKTHIMELAGLKDKYKKDVTCMEEKYERDLATHRDAFDKKFNEGLKKSKADEQRKTEQEAAKLERDKETQEKARAIRRNDLLARALKRSTDIKMLYNRQQDGTIARARDSEVLSMQECVQGLTDLWAEQGALITRILPHELSNDRDFALEFEAETVVMAQAWMQALELRGAGQELLQTGWSLTALHRLMCGLFPYHETDMTTLYKAVVDVHRILQQATASMHGGQVRVMLQVPNQTLAASVGSFVSPQPSPAEIERFYPPQTHQNSFIPQGMSDQQQLIPSIRVSKPTPTGPLSSTLSQQPFHQESEFSYTEPQNGGLDINIDMDGYESDHPTTHDGLYQPQGAPLPTNSVPPAQPRHMSNQPRACWNMRDKYDCRKGDSCRYSHDPELIAAARVSAQTEASGGDGMEGIVANPQPSTADNWRANIPCKWSKLYGFCTTADCGFMHPEGVHRPSNGAMSNGNQGTVHSKQCNVERNQGRCTRQTCSFIHQHPHGPPGEAMDMGDASSNTGIEQCKLEDRTGHCDRKKCNWAHQHPHGPHQTGIANSPDSVHSFGRQDNQPSSYLKGVVKNSLAARMSYAPDNWRGGNVHSTPPTGPRAESGSLASRMTFPSGNDHPAQLNADANPFTPSGQQRRGGNNFRGGQGGRGGRDQNQGTFSSTNFFQGGQNTNVFRGGGGQSNNQSENPFQGGGGNNNRGYGNTHREGRGGGRGERGRGGGAFRTGFGQQYQ